MVKRELVWGNRVAPVLVVGVTIEGSCGDGAKVRQGGRSSCTRLRERMVFSGDVMNME